jgi:tetratricopeptide (TPR) repeat protein
LKEGKSMCRKSIVAVTIPLVLLFACGSKEYERAEKLHQEGRYQEAFEQLEKAIKKNPENADPYFLMGECCLNMGEWDCARENFTSASRIDAAYKDKAVESLISVGHSLFDEYNKNHSILYDIAIEMDPNTKERLGEYYCDKFKEVWATGLEWEDPEDEGSIAESKGFKVRFINLSVTCRKYSPEMTPASYLKPMCEFMKTQAEVAKGAQELRKAIYFAFNTGRCQHQKDKKFRKEAVELLVDIGIQAGELGKSGLMKTAFEKALALDPNHHRKSEDFLYYLAVYYEEKGDMMRAEELYRELSADFPQGKRAKEVQKRLPNIPK